MNAKRLTMFTDTSAAGISEKAPRTEMGMPKSHPEREAQIEEQR